MVHEQQMHLESCMVNLTYNDAHLPQHGQLLKSDLQKFFKRLRKLIGPFRYVACGEYGERRRRPHFHIALYGRDFREERLFYGHGSRGDPMFTAKTIADAWSLHGESLGLHTLGTLTFESAAYIARYITQALNESDKLSLLPLHVDKETGEIIKPNPPFLVMSRANGGIGAEWFDKYFAKDVFPHGRVITPGGKPAPIPTAYKRRLRKMNGGLALQLAATTRANEASRSVEQMRYEDSNERRAARTKYAKARTGVFARDMGLLNERTE